MEPFPYKTLSDLISYPKALPLLDMACRAVVGHLRSCVTFHAPTHGHVHPWFRRGSLTFLHVPVTHTAFQLAQNDMTPVGIEDVIRLLVDLPPNDFLFLSLELPDFFLFGVLRDRVLMALQTDGDFWQPGEGLRFIKRMAGVALQSLFKVFLVVEGNRLPGFEPLAEGDAEEKQDNADQDSDEEIFHFPISPNLLA